MSAAEQAVLIYTTFPNEELAKEIGGRLVFEKLAACVNLFPGMISLYEWEGKMEQASEVAGFIKTRKALEQAVMDRLKSLHPYQTPAILVLDVENGSPEFLSWIAHQTPSNDQVSTD